MKMTVVYKRPVIKKYIALLIIAMGFNQNALIAAPKIIPEILSAWYGADGEQYKNADEKYAPQVTQKLKEVVSKYGFLAIPGNMNAFYGFDPLPNITKTTAIYLKYNGAEQQLRAPEGTDFIFPSDVPWPQAQKALTELKASLTIVPIAPLVPAKPLIVPAHQVSPAGRPITGYGVAMMPAGPRKGPGNSSARSYLYYAATANSFHSANHTICGN